MEQKSKWNSMLKTAEKASFSQKCDPTFRSEIDPLEDFNGNKVDSLEGKRNNIPQKAG